jgi:hypothetical protein
VTALKLPGLPFALEPEGSPPPGCRVTNGDTLTLTAAARTDMFVDPAGADQEPDAGRFVPLARHPDQPERGVQRNRTALEQHARRRRPGLPGWQHCRHLDVHRAVQNDPQAAVVPVVQHQHDGAVEVRIHEHGGGDQETAAQ